ncbi:hypothetical protein AV530_010894 [Patagioenas fasciata monilis]|uniref:Short transmembrane mitochondrial protein 1 n=1 Tax=Patagioenas fasciata monilis TaxID=372326 RepID=A0A1V4K8C5_PATFA|nr:hypothetical protein AV530_010894 [Patagioenas fasciata monilis]
MGRKVAVCGPRPHRRPAGGSGEAGRVGFTLGNVVGMYLAQNYDIPNIAKKLEEFKKDVEAKKKPPSDKS